MSILKKKVYSVSDEMKDKKKKSTLIEDFKAKTNPVIEDEKKIEVIGKSTMNADVNAKNVEDMKKKDEKENVIKEEEEEEEPSSKPNLKKRHSVISGRSDFCKFISTKGVIGGKSNVRV